MNRLRAVSALAVSMAVAAAVACSEASFPTQAPLASAAVDAIPNPGLSVDQTSGTGTGATSYGCGYQVSGILGQSFKPSWRTLGAIDIVLRAGGEFPAEGVQLTLDLYTYQASAPNYSLVGTSSSFVPGATTVGDLVTVRFQFLPPLLVKPGSTYRMQWTAPGDEVLTWMEGGSYALGIPWVCGMITPSLPGFDFAFSTYRVGR